MKLTAELHATGAGTTGLRIPEEFVARLGGGGRPKVVVTSGRGGPGPYGGAAGRGARWTHA